MRYSKLVPGGIYERVQVRGTMRGIMTCCELRKCGTITGELKTPGFKPLHVEDSNVDDFGNWRYVGGGLAFTGYAAPDVRLSGPEQMLPPSEGLDIDNLSGKQLLEKADEFDIPTHKRKHDAIRAELREALA